MLEISSWGQFNSIQYPVIVWLGNLDKLHMVHILDVALPAPIVVKVYQHIEAETNCRHFTDDIFKGIFLNADVLIALKISLKFVPNIRINNIPSLIKDNGVAPIGRQAIIWINGGNFTDAYMRNLASVSHKVKQI